MTLDYSITLRNNRLSQIQATIGAGGHLIIFSGPEPPSSASPDPVGPIVTINLPFPFLTVSNAQSAINGTWQAPASANGVAQCFRMYDASNNCHVQGGVPAEMTISPGTTVANGQLVTVTAFNITAGNP